ncbi:MAG: hypothetical protein PHG02_09240 [Oscillospiraceae bacterium]|nr:hypothetical protein [Oscillospiraceae bacterium]
MLSSKSAKLCPKLQKLQKIIQSPKIYSCILTVYLGLFVLRYCEQKSTHHQKFTDCCLMSRIRLKERTV